VVTRALVVFAVAAAIVVGCFSVTVPNGTIACSNDSKRPCPSGFVCVRDRCWTPQTSFLSDGGSDGLGDGGGD
jgi:hypothetical protein